jgi:hypothetical protein
MLCFLYEVHKLVVIVTLYDSFIRADIYVEATALKIGDHLVNYTDKFFI